MSLELIHLLGIPPDTGVVDIGGGASLLVDSLLDEGFRDVSVLDLSAAALSAVRSRQDSRPSATLLLEDLFLWRPERSFGLWHDRALFHFLVDAAEIDAYLEKLRMATVPGGAVIIATFAPDGPDHCSGLPVARYASEQLVSVIGGGFHFVTTRREEHTTPDGAVQPYTWVAERLQG